MQNVEYWVVLGQLDLLKVVRNSIIRYSVYEFLLAFHSNCVHILHVFWGSEILLENLF